MTEKVANQKLLYVGDVTINTALRFIKVSETVIELMQEFGITEVIIKLTIEGTENENKSESN